MHKSGVHHCLNWCSWVLCTVCALQISCMQSMDNWLVRIFECFHLNEAARYDRKHHEQKRDVKVSLDIIDYASKLQSDSLCTWCFVGLKIFYISVQVVFLYYSFFNLLFFDSVEVICNACMVWLAKFATGGQCSSKKNSILKMNNNSNKRKEYDQQ